MKLQEKMFAMVQAWQKSGMTRPEFLSGKSISLSKFDYWIYKYRKITKHSQSGIPARSSSEDFKSFVLSDQDTCGKEQSVSMEIITPSGVRITIYH